MLLSLTLSACDSQTYFRNVVPRIETVGPFVYRPDDNILEIHFSIRDHEEDPVDVNLEALDGERVLSLTPAWGSHGLRGLTSSRAPEGTGHVFLWDLEATDDVPAAVRLRFTPIDQNEGTGDPVESPEFDPHVGWPGP